MRLSQSARRSVGFTLVELLVVIGIIALLISILLPSLNNARKAALNVKCQANLHNIGNALLVYSSSNRGKLPASTLKANPFSDDNWMWDLDISSRDMLVKAGATRAVFYCPAAPANLKDYDFVWTYPKTAPNGSWTNDSMNAWLRAKTDTDRLNGCGILGYICLIRRADGPGVNANGPGITYGGTGNTNLQNSGDGRWVVSARTWKYQTSIVPDNRGCIVKVNANGDGFLKSNSSSETEIFADVVGCDSINRDFSKLPGGLTPDVYQGSSHMGRNQTPTGGNILFLDGHVQFRAFNSGSKFNPKSDGFPGSRPADYFSPDVIHWRCDTLPVGNTGNATSGTAGIFWYF